MTKKGPEPGSGPFFTEILNIVVVLHRIVERNRLLFCAFLLLHLCGSVQR